MNQILSVEMQNKKSRTKTKQVDIKSIIIFFCIVIIIFGVVLVGLGIYSKTHSNNNVETVKKPKIEMVEDTSSISIAVTSEEPINTVAYSWSNGEQGEELGNGRTNFEFTISIPSGTNTLTVTATDTKGGQEQSQKELTNADGSGAGSGDLEGVEISQKEATNTINFTVENETTISYLSYYYDDDEPTTKEINDVKAEGSMDVIEGEHKLTISIVDANGEEKKTTKTIYIPYLSVVTDTQNFIINASDNGKITKVVIKYYGPDGQEDSKEIELEDDENTYENTIPLQQGENRIQVTVYNLYKGSITRRVKWVKD